MLHTIINEQKCPSLHSIHLYPSFIPSSMTFLHWNRKSLKALGGGEGEEEEEEEEEGRRRRGVCGVR